MANGHGGARKNAGRPSKAEKYGGKIAEVEDYIAENLLDVVKALVHSAKGVQVLDQDEDEQAEPGNDPIYREPPNVKAANILVERLMGKATQPVELSGQDGGPIEVEATHRTQAEAEMDEWLATMSEKLSSLPSAPPTTGTSSTPTG